jgi:hypothetical protein
MEAPEYYRGIKVPEKRKRYWDKPTMRAWREAVDATYAKALEDMEILARDTALNANDFFMSDWAEGAQYGRDDKMEDVVSHFHFYATEDPDVINN